VGAQKTQSQHSPHLIIMSNDNTHPQLTNKRLRDDDVSSVESSVREDDGSEICICSPPPIKKQKVVSNITQTHTVTSNFNNIYIYI
jgi:hypothetical protein